MNWGWKIAIFYCGFVVLILSLVVGSLRQDFHMVSDSYYAEEGLYSERLAQKQAAQSLDTPMEMAFSPRDRQLQLTFPNSALVDKGTVTFYRASDARLDQEIALNTAKHQTVATDQLIPGRWEVKVYWESNGQAFFDEKGIYVPGTQAP
ncbi:FixH family protein [Pontibacter sp. G13]|uniref:FixH family protein n=1 Tax=Pontibacter sp. G13 TaxID=3074898 RepID=UPI00288BDF96|nr:FixH family protein [Pontibacter sp. G13]WNJ16108.1 FixH family protein [Pontibacter sp. G13]